MADKEAQGRLSNDITYGRWKFTWTTNELDEADRTLTQVADFNKALTAENYKVMAFK